MRFLDANIFLRYLTRDDEAKADACFRLFQRLKSGQERATTSEVIIAEVVYVLAARALYNLRPDEISARLRPLLAVRGLKIAHKRSCLRALDLYATYPFLDFEDALAVAEMERQGMNTILSYDRDFDRLEQVRREEP
jgi:predicted nucleic acid-binding protein